MERRQPFFTVGSSPPGVKQLVGDQAKEPARSVQPAGWPMERVKNTVSRTDKIVRHTIPCRGRTRLSVVRSWTLRSALIACTRQGHRQRWRRVVVGHCPRPNRRPIWLRRLEPIRGPGGGRAINRDCRGGGRRGRRIPVAGRLSAVLPRHFRRRWHDRGDCRGRCERCRRRRFRAATGGRREWRRARRLSGFLSFFGGRLGRRRRAAVLFFGRRRFVRLNIGPQFGCRGRRGRGRLQLLRGPAAPPRTVHAPDDWIRIADAVGAARWRRGPVQRRVGRDGRFANDAGRE